MKFGKKLNDELMVAAWQENYVQYETLKKLIWAASNEGELQDNFTQTFVADLEASVERVLVFIEAEAARISEQLAALPQGASSAAGKSLLADLATLEQFIVVNTEALRKIVKKATRRVPSFKRHSRIESSLAERSAACVQRVKDQMAPHNLDADLEVEEITDGRVEDGVDVSKSAAAAGTPIEDAASNPNAPLVLMAKRNTFVVEGQGCAVVVVHRLGGKGVRCEVDFTTGSVGGHKAGSADFKKTSGTLVFGPDDAEKRIRVPLMEDSQWEPMERFCVTLSEARGAILGKVNETLVHIVDDDVYPASLPPDASEWQLLRAFWRERWRHRWPKPLKSLLYDMYDSFHDLFGTYFPLICADRRVRKEPMWLLAFAAAYSVSAAFNWYCSYKFQDLRGNSGTRKDWRNWLVNGASLSSVALSLLKAFGGIHDVT